MAYEQTEGIVLRKVDFSESSWIVTLLTPYRGRMACMVKGARRKGSPMTTLLDTYNRVEITYVWRDSRQVQLLTEATLLESYSSLKASVEHIACAAFLLEITGIAAQENNPAPELFLALRNGLEEINKARDAPWCCTAQNVYRTLEAAGLTPDPADPAFLEITNSYGRERREHVRHAITELACSDKVAAVRFPPDVLCYLKDHTCHYFERPLKSYSFLAGMLRESE